MRRPVRMRAAAMLVAAAAFTATAAPERDARADAASEPAARVSADPLPAHRRAAASKPATPLRWLALGDSYSSGEGMLSSTGDCARSDQAWAPAAYDILMSEQFPLGDIEFLACSGAETKTHPGTESVDLDRQIAQSDGRYDLITLTIGGNNTGWGDVIRTCVTTVWGRCWALMDQYGIGQRLRDEDPRVEQVYTGLEMDRWEPGPLQTKVLSMFEQELVRRMDLDGLGRELKRVYGDLRDRKLTAGGHVVVLGYPRLFEATETWRWYHGMSCQTVEKPFIPIFRRAADKLNATIERAAARYGDLHFVDVASMFEGHNLCPRQWMGTWINGISTGLTKDRFRIEASFHPKYEGYQAEAARVAEVVKSLDWGSLGRGVIAHARGLRVVMGHGRRDVDIDLEPLRCPPRCGGSPIDIVDALSSVLGKPVFEWKLTQCPGEPTVTAWGSALRPSLAVTHSQPNGVLRGYRILADDRYVTPSDGVVVGQPLRALKDTVYEYEVTYPKRPSELAVESMQFVLKPAAQQYPTSAPAGPLAGSEAGVIYERGSGDQCGLWAGLVHS